jgi:HAE1 family hydrophobic/amphiphilic exporter-1
MNVMLMLNFNLFTKAIEKNHHINEYHRHVNDNEQAITNRQTLRKHNIIMTACATIFALLPMAIGLTGGGAFISKSLAIVVIGGLVSSTLLTLLLVPALYVLHERRTERRAAKRAARAESAPGEDAANVTDLLNADRDDELQPTHGRLTP